jgi:hypothetical protein
VLHEELLLRIVHHSIPIVAALLHGTRHAVGVAV